MGIFVMKRILCFFVVFLCCCFSLTSNAYATNRNCEATFDAEFSADGKFVTASSSKDLSHVNLYFCGEEGYFKFDDLNVGHSHTFTKGKQLRKVKIKAGCSYEYFHRECEPETFEPELSCVAEYESDQHAFWFAGKDYVTASDPLKLDEKADGTATLSGTIVRRGGAATDTFEVAVELEQRTSTPDQSPKNPFGVSTDDWRYYLVVGGGVVGSGDNDGVVISFSRRGPAFQIGVGANDKDKNDLGASTWFNYKVEANPHDVDLPFADTGVGDINVDVVDCPTDCAGDPFGDKVYDECGVCGGDNSTCLDCAGVPNGSSVLDECGICDGSGKDECGNCPDTQNPIVKDSCGVCGGDNSSCTLEVCEVVDGDYDNAKVVTILDSQFDATKHFDVAQCEPTTICLKHLEGPTKVVPYIAFFNKYRHEGALLGECQLAACVKDETGRYASVKFLLESELEKLLASGRATKDLTQCETVRICVNPNANPPTAKNIPKFVADWYTNQGYKLGECPIKVCRPGIESLDDATVIEIDPSERLDTDLPVEQCEPTTICLDGQTLTLPKAAAILYIVNEGATEGECDTECTKTHDECYVECEAGYDPLWIPKCVQYCVETCGIYCEDKEDCFFEELLPETCSQVNGFLGQVNIASVINKSEEPLTFNVKYRDLEGVVKDTVTRTIEPKVKWDIIVNDMGLEADTYGTVCAQADTTEVGQWDGGVTMYKSVEGQLGAGAFDFAMYYPFLNPTKGFQTAPMNTFQIGGTSTANWIRITDAYADGHPLGGTLFYYRIDGSLAGLERVDVPDGGRRDYGSHEELGQNATGTAVFAPDFVNGQSPDYYFTSARYIYNCPDAPLPNACTDFLTAFSTPARTPIKGKVFNQVSHVEDMTVIELNNPLEKPASASVRIFDATGNVVFAQTVSIPSTGNFHLIVNEILNGQAGYAEVDAGDDFIIAITSQYDFLDTFTVGYGYATPFSRLVPKTSQMTEYNSFIGHVNVLEISNTLNQTSTATIKVVDATGAVVYEGTELLSANQTVRRELDLPKDSYGVITVDGAGLIARSYVTNPSSYTLPFVGK